MSKKFDFFAFFSEKSEQCRKFRHIPDILRQIFFFRKDTLLSWEEDAENRIEKY